LKPPPHLIQGSFLPGFPIPVVVKIPESVSLHHLKPELPADGKGVVAGVLPGLASGAVQGQDPFGTRGKLGDIRAAQPPVVSPDTNPAIPGLPLEDFENFHVHGQGNPSVKPVVIQNLSPNDQLGFRGHLLKRASPVAAAGRGLEGLKQKDREDKNQEEISNNPPHGQSPLRYY
jgi:hypothetical protein